MLLLLLPTVPYRLDYIYFYFSPFFISLSQTISKLKRRVQMMNFSMAISSFLIAILLLSPSYSLAAGRNHDLAGEKDGGYGGMFGPGNGFDNLPGFGKGWDKGIIGGGYGGGYGGPKGGYSKGGIIRNTVVCREKGPCYKKKVTCPAKCFTSYSRSGKGFGGGGGGGGCTIDCTKKCIGYC